MRTSAFRSIYMLERADSRVRPFIFSVLVLEIPFQGISRKIRKIRKTFSSVFSLLGAVTGQAVSGSGECSAMFPFPSAQTGSPATGCSEMALSISAVNYMLF